MTGADGRRPEDAERSLGEIVAEVSENVSRLVREEVELVRAEVTQKVTRLGKGALVGAVGATFLLFSLIYGFFFLAFLLNDLLDFENVWLGFLLVTVLLLLLGALAVALAVRLLKRGSPPVPELAIEEARRTIEEARS